MDGAGITKGGDTPSADQDRFATIEARPVPSTRLKTSLAGHLDFHASQRWRQLEEITITWRGGYGYVTTHLPDGNPSGTPKQALDCSLGLYLADPTTWINPPTD